MARVNAQQWMDKWGTNLTNSTQYIKAGVDRVQTAPSQTAIAAKDRMKANLIASIDNGSWENGLSKVSLADWQNAMKNKGINNLTAGIATAKTRKLANVQAMLAANDAAVAAVNNLPKGGLQQGIARMTAFVTTMYNNAPKRAGRSS